MGGYWMINEYGRFCVCIYCGDYYVSYVYGKGKILGKLGIRVEVCLLKEWGNWEIWEI